MPTRSSRKATSSKKSSARRNRIADAEKRIKSAKDDFEFLKILVYGKPKRGKTTFGASGPKPIIIDCNERGTLSVRNVPDLKVFRLETWTDIDMIYWYLHNGNHDRETAVIDTMSSLASLCMKFVLGDEVSRDPTKDPAMPSKREYGKVNQLMNTEILKWRNLPMHVVFLAQERRGYTEDEDDAPEVFPELSPGVRNTLTPAVDIIGRIYVQEVAKTVVREVKGKKKKVKITGIEHRLLIGQHEVYTTGDRSEVGLPGIIRLGNKQDSLTRLIDRIKTVDEEG